MLEQLLVRNITLPNSVKASIESKINAEQDAKKIGICFTKRKTRGRTQKSRGTGYSRLPAHHQHRPYRPAIAIRTN